MTGQQMCEAGMQDEDIDNIEAAAEGKNRGLGRPFAHPADTLALIAEIRRLKSLLNAKQDANKATTVPK